MVIIALDKIIMTIDSGTPLPSPDNDSVCEHSAMQAFPQEKISHYTPLPLSLRDLRPCRLRKFMMNMWQLPKSKVTLTLSLGAKKTVICSFEIGSLMNPVPVTEILTYDKLTSYV